jgi:hypothetical protein
MTRNNAVDILGSASGVAGFITSGAAGPHA